MIGGISSWIGAFIGAVLLLLFQPVFDLPLVHNSYIAQHVFHGQLPNLLPVFFGLGAIGLAQNPHGVVEQIREGWGGFTDLVGKVVGFVRGRRGAVEAGEPEAAAAAEPTTPAAATNGQAVAFPHGRLYHRPDCVLTVGKDGGSAVTVGGADLQPCPVCDPEPVGSS